MFHVLTKDSVPKFLSAGYEGKPVSSVLCGAGVGERREAISYEKCNTYLNNGNLRLNNMCSKCAKKLNINIPKRGKNDVTT